jgi:small subunit ribosomal protein S1
MAKDINIMESLLQNNPLDLPVIGEDIKGKVLDIGTNAMYVDLGPIGTGVVLGEELHDGFGTIKTLKKGDEVTATVITTNTADGYIELSLRQASEDKVWDDLFAKQASEEPVDVKIIDANKGGLLISINGISGFLPVSQLAYDHYPRVDGGDKTKILGRLKEYTGDTFRVAIINVNREENKLIVSEKAARKSEEMNLVNSYQKGDTIEGEVTGVVDFGVFVKFGKNGQKLEGLVHISELSWQLVENPRDLYKEGDKVKAQVIEIVNGKVSLSIKALTEDPWNKITEKFSVDQVVEGQVARMNHFGIFVQLDPEVRGLVHNSEIEKDRPKYTELKEGNTAQFKILSIDPQEHRISLALV